MARGAVGDSTVISVLQWVAGPREKAGLAVHVERRVSSRGGIQVIGQRVHVGMGHAGRNVIGVSYYDFRNNTPAATLETDYFLVHCHPTTPTACTNAANWGDEVQLTDASFDMRQAPDAGGFFTGDYEGLDNTGNAFTPFFSQTHGTDPSSTFFKLVG